MGWIGRHRLEAVVESGVAEVVAIADPDRDAVEAALSLAPGAAAALSLEEVLEAGVDGVVIATPSALHAQESVAALEAGAAVFCQKPLGRTAVEVERVVAAARDADRLLGVDLSYRHTAGMQAVRELVRGGALGEVYAVDLVFHNAYGPDKLWFYDPELSGGGCVMDLGIHLVDLALWTMEGARVTEVSSQLFARGEALPRGAADRVEDYGVAQLILESGTVVRLATSWRLPAGCDAVIEASFYGTEGGASFRNLNGSFYDFVAEWYRGTAREVVASPPDRWGGRAAVAWAEALAGGAGFDPAVAGLVEVAITLDRIYGR